MAKGVEFRIQRFDSLFYCVQQFSRRNFLSRYQLRQSERIVLVVLSGEPREIREDEPGGSRGSSLDHVAPVDLHHSAPSGRFRMLVEPISYLPETSISRSRMSLYGSEDNPAYP